jgi:hypothetical protein
MVGSVRFHVYFVGKPGLERDPEITTETLRLHRLVREVAAARWQGKAREEMIRALLEAVTAVYPEVEEVFTNPKTWPRARRLDSLALALVEENLTPPAGAETHAVKLLRKLSWYKHTALGTYAQARALEERALATCRASEPEQTRQIAPSCATLAQHFIDKVESVVPLATIV